MKTFLIAAMTIDGFIGRSVGDRSFDWTSDEDKQFYISKIKTAHAIVIGSKTFETFSRYPKGSRWIIYSSKPNEFVNPKPAVIRAEATNESPQVLIAKLEKEGVNSIAICGGSSIYSMFLQHDLIDELFLTVEPVIFGQGVKLFRTHEVSNKKFKLVELKQLKDNSTLLLHYQREL